MGALAACNGRGIHLWDVNSGEPMGTIARLSVGEGSNAFNSAGSMIAIAGVNQTVRVWDARTGEQFYTLVVIRLTLIAWYSVRVATRLPAPPMTHEYD